MDKKQYKALIKDISDSILQHDPIGLKGTKDLPVNEYDAEAGAIATALSNCPDADRCTALVWKVFVDSFGEQTAGPQESYRPLAEEIRKRFLASVNDR